MKFYKHLIKKIGLKESVSRELIILFGVGVESNLIVQYILVVQNETLVTCNEDANFPIFLVSMEY